MCTHKSIIEHYLFICASNHYSRFYQITKNLNTYRLNEPVPDGLVGVPVFYSGFQVLKETLVVLQDCGDLECIMFWMAEPILKVLLYEVSFRIDPFLGHTQCSCVFLFI